MRPQAYRWDRTRRIVIKLGTGLLTDANNRLAVDRIEPLVASLSQLRGQHPEIIVVTSGAIAAGMETLGFQRRPKHLEQLQAAAAVGQSKLMAVYDRLFRQTGLDVAQVLLTHDDLRNRARHLNARRTLTTLLDRGIVPIINENDTVAVDEIKFGDNDRLGALTATLIDADLLIILSHVAGLLDRNQQVISVVPSITPEIESLAGGTTRDTSVGGMKSKIDAARIVTRAGIPMIIASGEQPQGLTGVLAGEDAGTLFLPHSPKLASRKRWIAFFQHPTGALTVDDGARQALCVNGKSLLAKGIAAVDGPFQSGDVVSIRDRSQVEIARGIVKIGDGDLKPTSGVIVHRDDLVIL